MIMASKSSSDHMPGARHSAGAAHTHRWGKKYSGEKPKRGLSRLMLLYFLLIALIPLLAISTLNFLAARATLLEIESGYLSSIAQRQVNEVRNYLNEVDSFISLLSQTPGVIFTLGSLDQVNETDLPTMQTSPKYQEIEKNVGPLLQQMTTRFGFSQLYLINPQGIVVYATPYLELKHRNLYAEPDGQTELGEVFQRTTALMSNQASDFRIYPPVQSPSLFVSAPVLHEGTFLGAIVLAIDNNDLNEKLSDLTGLGDSAEVVFASREGDKILVLNDLKGMAESAFTYEIPFEAEQESAMTPIQRAVHGMSGGGLAYDYSGDEVLALWDYLPNLRIGLVVKIDKKEIFAPVAHLLRINLAVGALTALVVIAVALYLSRSITNPIKVLTEAANRLANGDLSGEIPSHGNNEVGQLANATRTMARNLKSLVGKVKVTGSEISKTAQFINSNAQQQVSAAQQTGASAIEVNTTAKQIATTAKELADTMQQVNTVTQQTALKAESGLDVLNTIEQSMSRLAVANTSVSDQLNLIQTRADAITGIIATMTQVADQTNLLSLNAAIEAKKAGQYGRGFSVVANEIRRLADQAASSTLDIEGSVKEMVQAVRTGVKGMTEFSTQVANSVEEITEISSRLTEVIQQVQGLPPRFDQILEGMQSQAEGAGQINEAMHQLSHSAQETASAVKETHRMLGSLRRSAEILEAEISRFKT